MAERKTYTDEERRAIFELVIAILYEYPLKGVQEACEIADVNYYTFNGWVGKYPEFHSQLLKFWELHNLAVSDMLARMIAAKPSQLRAKVREIIAAWLETGIIDGVKLDNSVDPKTKLPINAKRAYELAGEIAREELGHFSEEQMKAIYTLDRVRYSKKTQLELSGKDGGNVMLQFVNGNVEKGA
jgi:hypothetical protein